MGKSLIELLDGIAAASPEVVSRWRQEARYADPEGDLAYVAAAVLARVVLDAAEAGESGVSAAMRRAEECLRVGTPSERNLLIVGFIEALQGLVVERPSSEAAIGPLLTGEIAQAWGWLHALWAGEMSAEVFNRHVDGTG